MFSPSGDSSLPGEAQTLSQFALVAYIPHPLGSFLDDLRLELNPGCRPRAHATILPPRPLYHEVAETVREINEELKSAHPFRIELGEIETFEGTNVVYLDLKEGFSEMRELYKALNRGCLEYSEPFPYHPHITIAQNITADESIRMAATARERWAQYRGPRGMEVSVLSFVQHVAPSIWADIASLPLGAAVPVPVPVSVAG